MWASETGNLSDGTTRAYADQMGYDAAGHLTKERFGTSQLLYHHLHYNVRPQLYDNRVSYRRKLGSRTVGL
jgi:hypothetical protein